MSKLDRILLVAVVLFFVLLLIFSLVCVKSLWPFIFISLGIGLLVFAFRGGTVNKTLVGVAIMLMAITAIASWDRISSGVSVVEAASDTTFSEIISTPATPDTTPETPSQDSEVKNAPVESCSLSLSANISSWCGLIEESAKKYNVDPKLIAAVMLQESGGQSDVISASGAVGLLQVMPRDGIAAGFQCGNGPCFANRPSTQELLDPAYNVDFGSKMLAGLITKWGNERDALKAYGPYDVGYYYADKVLVIKNNE